MKNKIWIGCSAAAVMLVVAAILFVVFTQPDAKVVFVENPEGLKNQDIAPEFSLPEPPAAVKTEKPIPPMSSKVAEPTIDTNHPADDQYSIEKEIAFIEEAMETIPSLTEVDVHKPGVVFFRHKPDRPEALEKAMNDLAEMYQVRLEYGEPVNVVFFISGRPMKSKVFFRD